MELPDYTNTSFNKQMNFRGKQNQNVAGTSMYGMTGFGQWNNAAAINRVDAFTGSGNFTAGSVLAVYGYGGTALANSFHGCRAYNDGGQTIANTTVVAVTFNTEAFDTDAIHDTVTNPSRFTVPAGYAGKWSFSYKASFIALAGGARITFMRKNGTDIPGAAVEEVGSGSGRTTNTNTVIVDLAVGDYVELFIYQTSGSTVTLGNTVAVDAGLVTTMEAKFLG